MSMEIDQLPVATEQAPGFDRLKTLIGTPIIDPL